MKYSRQFKIPLIFFFIILILCSLIIYKFWPVFAPSTAKVSLENERIAVKFSLNEADKFKAKALSEKLGVSDDWTKGGLIKLDNKNTESLKPFLPLDLQLEFKENEVAFNSNKFEALINQYLRKLKDQNQEQISPLGGNFKMNGQNGEYLIEIDNPREVLNQATISGALKVSPELSNSSLWQTIDKLAKIKLRLEQNKASGKIIFK